MQYRLDTANVWRTDSQITVFLTIIAMGDYWSDFVLGELMLKIQNTVPKDGIWMLSILIQS